MKKLDFPEWEENREYIRTHIMPKLQELQRDMYGSSEFTTDLATSRDGGVTFGIVAWKGSGIGEIAASAYFSFYYTRNPKYNEKMYKGIAGFIKKHSA